MSTDITCAEHLQQRQNRERWVRVAWLVREFGSTR